MLFILNKTDTEVEYNIQGLAPILASHIYISYDNFRAYRESVT